MKSISQRVAENWKSGLTVSLVSIPLSVSLAVASQTSPVVGIITAIWAGFIASLFGGSNFNIIGPTGALSGLLAAYAIAHGMESLAMLAIATGVVTLLAYAFRLERFLVFIPASTIHGFTLGVALIIGLTQLNYAIGLSGLPVHQRLVENILESLNHLSQASWTTFTVFILFTIGMFACAKLTPKIPGAILLAPLGILLGYLGSNDIIHLPLQTLGMKFSNLNGQLFQAPHFFFNYSLVVTSLTVALVAILETMLSAKIADGMTRTKHNKRKEMLGLGLANIASGLMGGIPATAALARTSLNIKTGANDKLSATVNSIAVAVISLVLLSYFKYIPMAVIAAILVFVAVRMVEVHHFARFYRYDKKSFVVALIVAFVTFYQDPIIGILLGTTISLLIFVEKLSRGQFDLTANKQEEGIIEHVSGEKITRAFTKSPDTLLYSIKGQLAYINSQAHITRFERDLSDYKNVILRLKELHFIDLDGVDALDEIIDIIHSQGKTVLLTGVNPYIATSLHNECHNYKKLEQDGLVFGKISDAFRHLGYGVK
ncbi:MAG TPA: SulP family inorganic anion transporter [Patescibacteria group bacterium]